MQMSLLWAGRILGLVGVALTAVAVATRVGGSYVVGSYQASTVLIAGMAAMTGASLAYVASIAERTSRS